MTTTSIAASNERFLRAVCLPQLKTVHRQAQERYVFLMQMHQAYRHVYVNLSYWTSWLGVLISVLSAAQQVVMAVNATFSQPTTISGFIVNTCLLILGLVVRENTKTIKSSSHFSQSINEQVYQFADLTTESFSVADQLRTLAYEDHFIDPADCPSIEEMNETINRFTEGLHAATIATTRIIEAFDSELPSVPLSSQTQQSSILQRIGFTFSSDRSSQQILARWNQLVTRQSLKHRRLSLPITDVGSSSTDSAESIPLTATTTTTMPPSPVANNTSDTLPNHVT
jgi:hypothetical protein